MLELKFLSSLEKIFPDQGELDAQPIESGIAARGERYSFQVALRSDEPGIYRVSFESDFNVRVRLVEAVPVMLPANQPDENMLRTVPGLYPDRLDELECSDRFRILPRQWRCLWVTVMVPAMVPAMATALVTVLFSGMALALALVMVAVMVLATVIVSTPFTA